MENKNKIQPPGWANRFLEWYCRPDLLEEIQGDAYELFERSVKKSRTKATIQFIWNVVRFFRLRNIRQYKSGHHTNSFSMLKSYLLIGLRNVLRNGATSFINVFGLAVGVAGAITIFIFADQFFHTDDFQEKSDRIYEVTNVINRSKKSVVLSDVPIVLGPTMQQDAPGIEKVVRIELGSGAIRAGEKVFSETIYFVDDTFFDVFNFPFVEGNAKALNSRNSIILTDIMAQKYFGNQQAIGQSLSIKFGNSKIEEFTVSAVVNQPANNTMYFKFLLPIQVFFDLKLKDEYSWDYLTDATFILMKPGHRLEEVEEIMKPYVKLQNESNPEWRTEKFTFYPYESLRSRSYEIESGLVGSGHPQGVLAIGFIALLLLLLACFNYMNISVATVATRIKEIGIRKVIGGQRRQIIYQFVAENLLLCTFSILLGLGISYLFFMPWLNTLLQYEIPFAFSSGQSMVFFFVGLLLFIVLISGIYPSVYVSSFQPVTILKGKEKFGQRSKFSRALLTTQFVLAFTTIVGCFVFIDNSLYLKSKDWGYDHDQNIIVPLSESDQFLKLRDLVSKNKHVMNFAGSENHIGYWNSRSSMENVGERFEIVSYRVGFNYMETNNLRLVEGRFFDKEIQSDQIESVIVNENFVKAMGWTSGLNQVFEYDSVKRNVIGVVKNFHYDDFYRGILPVLFTITPEENIKYLSLRIEKGHVSETEDWLKKSWASIAPDDPYEGMLQDEVFANWAKNNKTDMKLLAFIAGLATMLSCLGLFGLVSYNITRKLKEFSIRKVFGASSLQIFHLMNRDYVWILSIAFIIGAPTGFFLMDNLIHHIYVDPQQAGALPFVIAITLIMLTVAITIGAQMNRILKENPTITLRSE
jgi:putative ABC transport system permease protein